VLVGTAVNAAVLLAAWGFRALPGRDQP